jgi:hypothetical protein
MGAFAGYHHCSTQDCDLIKSVTESQSNLVTKMDLSNIVGGLSYILIQDHLPMSYYCEVPIRKMKTDRPKVNKENVTKKTLKKQLPIRFFGFNGLVMLPPKPRFKPKY